jgi:Carboxypeptidase regulatory-like domain
MKRILVLVAILLASGGASPAAYKVVPVENGGWITGRIAYAGPRAERKEIMPTVDAPVCGQHGMIPSDELVVSSAGGLQYAVIRLTNIAAGRPASDIPPTLLVQKGCMFEPHVFAVAVGVTVKERNTDGVLHNIHTHSARNPSVNFAHPPSIPEMPLASFAAQESVRVTCDVHSWMSAWIWVSPHPYIAVTGADGTYKIAGIPPGQYRLEVWHESLGKSSREVVVTAGKETRIDMSLPMPPAKSGAPGKK